MRRRIGAVAVVVGLAVAVAAVPALAARSTRAAGSAAGTAGSERGSDGCRLPVFGPGSAYRPHIEPDDFTATVDNPYFPLPPGRTLVYAGVRDGQPAVDVVTPSRRTRMVDGVQTRVVEDRLYRSGRLVERTADYYAQDRCGNVWYFGEDTAELDRHGRVVDRPGSFLAGVDGAQPGVFMQARPEMGRAFRQEWYPGEAEDVFAAIDRDARVTVPYGSFGHALRTRETTALEPAVVDNKYYVRGVGEVVELAVRGGNEKLVLVDVLS